MTKIKTWMKEHKTMIIGAVSLVTCYSVGYVFGSYGTFNPVKQRQIKDFAICVGEAAKGATVYTSGTVTEFAKLTGGDIIQAGPNHDQAMRVTGVMAFGNEVNP